MPITFDTQMELESFCRDFELTLKPSAMPKEIHPRKPRQVLSLSAQARLVIEEFIENRQPFTVYACVNRMMKRNPALKVRQKASASMLVYNILKVSYPKLAYDVVSEPHSRRPLKRFLP